METFGWDRHEEWPTLVLDVAEVGSGVSFETIGYHDDVADTMFTVVVDDDNRVIARRPEPMLVTYMRLLLEVGEFELWLTESNPEVIKLTADDRHGIARTMKQMKDVMGNAPLGQ